MLLQRRQLLLERAELRSQLRELGLELGGSRRSSDLEDSSEALAIPRSIAQPRSSGLLPLVPRPRTGQTDLVCLSPTRATSIPGATGRDHCGLHRPTAAPTDDDVQRPVAGERPEPSPIEGEHKVAGCADANPERHARKRNRLS